MAEVIVARWDGYKFLGNANTVAKEIKEIGENVKPENIVEYAESHKDSELHKCFTWDNDNAAYKWRLQEARTITCSLKITIVDSETKEEKQTPIRVFYKPNVSSGGYVATEVIVKNVDQYTSLLAQAKSELISFKKKYSTLKELNDVFEQIDLI